MTRTRLAAFLLVALAVLPLSAATRPAHRREVVTISGSVDHFADADTLFVKPEQGPLVKVRLHYADAPEISHRQKEVDQPGGRDALDYVKKNWQGKAVTVTVRGHSYDRIVGDVVEKDSGKNLALDLVRMGWAECDPRYKPPAEFRDAEKQSRDKQLGIWTDKVHVTPWDWRKEHRNGLGK